VQRVEHRLVSELWLAARGQPVEAGPQRPGKVVGGQLGTRTGGGTEPQEERSVEGTAGTADAAHQREADQLEQLVGRRRMGAVEFLDHGAHPTVHVDPVVAVTDGRVEVGEVGSVLVDQRGERADPLLQPGDRHGAVGHGWVPQVIAGVRTGASHNLISSSSTLRRVIEQPAISNEVTYEPTSERAIVMP
jgi:hypothetical protein